jgi:hypothetical protein
LAPKVNSDVVILGHLGVDIGPKGPRIQRLTFCCIQTLREIEDGSKWAVFHVPKLKENITSVRVNGWDRMLSTEESVIKLP